MANRSAILSHLAVFCLITFASAPFTSQVQGEALQDLDRPLVIGYFGHDGLYNAPYFLRDLVRNGGADLLDQMNYSHASVTAGRCSILDARADLETAYSQENSVNGRADDPTSSFRGYLHQLKLLKMLHPNLKVLISLEGAAADFRYDSQPAQRAGFVSSCVDMFLKGRFSETIVEPGIFDGIDVDWEYPEREDADNFLALLKEFREQMERARRGALLTIAVGDSPKMHPGTDFRSVSEVVDQVGVMNYDYTGPWNSVTGILAPLFRLPNAPNYYGSVAESLAAYEDEGVPTEKLLMGLPFYGYHWSEVDPANHGLHQTGHGVTQDLPYRMIQTFAARYSVYRDPRTRSPWLFDGADFWTFDDPVSIAYKTSFAADRGLGGVMIWELDQDTSEATLLNTVWRSLREPFEVPLGD
ncbi:chitinase [Acidobacteria bacterium AB60]|nr:chitinase [Acidobacteria bacterium AB60]